MDESTVAELISIRAQQRAIELSIAYQQLEERVLRLEIKLEQERLVVRVEEEK